MGLSIIRTIILYILVISAMRIMGKRTIGEMNPTEMVVAIMISDLATVPMQSKSTPIWDGIIPIFTLVVLETLFAFFILKSPFIRRVLVGRSCHVVRCGKLMWREMEKLRVTVEDIEEQIRIKGYSGLCDAEEVIIETNGQVSVIPKKNDSRTPYVVIVNGKVRKRDLKKAGLDMNKIKAQMKKEKIGSIKDILYLSGINSEIVYMQKR